MPRLVIKIKRRCSRITIRRREKPSLLGSSFVWILGRVGATYSAHSRPSVHPIQDPLTFQAVFLLPLPCCLKCLEFTWVLNPNSKRGESHNNCTIRYEKSKHKAPGNDPEVSPVYPSILASMLLFGARVQLIASSPSPILSTAHMPARGNCSNFHQ
jgi:hypothetical protein